MLCWPRIHRETPPSKSFPKMNKEKIYVVQVNALDDQTYQTRGNKTFSVKKLNKALALLPGVNV